MSQNQTQNISTAVTDLYDDQRQQVIVQFPQWLVFFLSATGIAAFVLTAFLPYDDAGKPLLPSGSLLFLWFCALIVTLQVAVLRDRSLVQQRFLALGMTLFSMLLVGLYYEFGTPTIHAGAFIKAVQTFLNNAPLFFIINFGLIALFSVDSIRRWIALARHQPVVGRINLRTGKRDASVAQPSLTELVSGDLLVGGLFFLLLAIVIAPDVITIFFKNLDVSSCTPIAVPCTGLGSATDKSFSLLAGGLLNDPRFLSLTDLILALLVLIPGLFILAPGAINNALQPPQPTDAPQGTISSSVSQEVLETIGAGFSRQARLSIWSNISIRLTSVGWPLLVLLSTFAIAGASKYISAYIQRVGAFPDCHTIPQAFLTCAGQVSPQGIEFQAFSLVGGAIWLIALVLSLGAQLNSLAVIRNTTRFLLIVAFILALTFWLFSLLLSVINVLIWLFTNQDAKFYFPQASPSMLLSFAFFLRFAIPWLVRRIRHNGNSSGKTPPPSLFAEIGAVTGGRKGPSGDLTV